MTATELADELRPMCDLAHAIAPCDRCGWPVITGKTSTPDYGGRALNDTNGATA